MKSKMLVVVEKEVTVLTFWTNIYEETMSANFESLEDANACEMQGRLGVEKRSYYIEDGKMILVDREYSKQEQPTTFGDFKAKSEVAQGWPVDEKEAEKIFKADDIAHV